MKIVFEEIESPPCCLLTLGTFTLMFQNRSEAESFLKLLMGAQTSFSPNRCTSASGRFLPFVQASNRKPDAQS